MIINPELAFDILKYRETFAIDNRSIFAEKKINAIKQVAVYIVYNRRRSIIRVYLI